MSCVFCIEISAAAEYTRPAAQEAGHAVGAALSSQCHTQLGQALPGARKLSQLGFDLPTYKMRRLDYIRDS